MNTVYISSSKKNFYLRSFISEFVLTNNCVPISPYMNFDYNMSGTVNKDFVRIANNTLIHRADELWVFGELSDGVVIEIYLAKRQKLPIRYFKINKNDYRIAETNERDVILEDVSPWMWEWVISGKNLSRWHPRLRFTKKYPLVYTAYSKKNFYWQMHISKFCMDNKTVPLNPFMLFRYFLSDNVPRELVYRANAQIIDKCDELWVFGDIADGVYTEVKQMERAGKNVKYFKINDVPSGVKFRSIKQASATLEEELILQLSEHN